MHLAIGAMYNCKRKENREGVTIKKFHASNSSQGLGFLQFSLAIL